MFRSRLVLLLAAGVLAGLAGCASTNARMVQVLPDGGGVVAVPDSSNSWPMYYREDAEKMMAAKCPNGYDILKEEEVVVGKTTHTNESVNPAMTSVVTSTSDRTEYRIHFRPKAAQPALPSGAAVIKQTSAMVPAGAVGLPPRPIPVTP